MAYFSLVKQALLLLGLVACSFALASFKRQPVYFHRPVRGDFSDLNPGALVPTLMYSVAPAVALGLFHYFWATFSLNAIVYLGRFVEEDGKPPPTVLTSLEVLDNTLLKHGDPEDLLDA